MADSDQVGVFFVQETQRGVTPASPVLQALRVTTPRVSISDRTVESNEMRPDRMTADYPAVAQDVTGEIGAEASYRNADALMEAAMCGTWANKPTLNPTAVTATQFTVASGGAAFRQGMLVRGSGFAQAANNGLFALAANGSGTAVTVTGAAAEASPPAGAQIKCVGFQGAAGDVQALANPPRLQMTSASGDWTGLGIVPGEWVQVGGAATANQFNTAGCNGWARVASVTAAVLTLDIAPPGWAADTGAGKTIRVGLGDRLDHGAVRRSFTVQRRFTDVPGGAFENSRGQEVNTMGMSLDAQAIAGMTFGLMGDTGALVNTQIAGATDRAAPTGDVMTTGTDMGLLCIDGVQVGVNDNSFVRQLSVNLDNQMRQRAALNNFGSVGRGLGRLRVEGSAQVYFESLPLAQKALTNQDTQFAWRVGDAQGRGYVHDLPAAKIDGSLEVAGANSDVMLPLTIRARRSPTLGYIMRIQRFDERV